MDKKIAFGNTFLSTSLTEKRFSVVSRHLYTFLHHKKLMAGVSFICLLLFVLSGCTAYNELANTSDTIIFTPRDEKGTEGQVIYFKSGCPYFIVNTILGYTVLELIDGKPIYIGDILEGDFESYGARKIYNASRGLSLNVMVENFWLTKNRAMEIYYEKCIQPEK